MKTALVTGASSGIGASTSRLLDERGYRVFAAARREDRLEALSREGQNIVPVPMDVASDASVDAALGSVLEEVGGALDVLVNNAGYGFFGGIEDSPFSYIRQMYETNVYGALRLCNGVLPGMRERGRGRIVVVASMAGRVVTPYIGAYASSKHALEGLVDAYRIESREFGVPVVLVEPGAIRTEFLDVAFPLMDRIRKDSGMPVHGPQMQSFRAAFAETFRRFGSEPEKVAKVILKAIEARRPRARYRAGADAKFVSFARRILPDGALDAMLTRLS